MARRPDPMLAVESPIADVPTSPQQLRKPRRPPAVTRPTASPTQAVLREVSAAGPGYFAVPSLGWDVLHRLWGLTAAAFDATALARLGLQPPFVQHHVLLMLSTTAVAAVRNLSAFLSCLVQSVSERVPVCLGFIAGCCHKDRGCPFAHPARVPAWDLLQERWQVGWPDFNYLVLNALLLRPEAQQAEILHSLVRMKLKRVRNPSALLASVIGHHPGKPRWPKVGPPPSPASAGAATRGGPATADGSEGTGSPCELSDASSEDSAPLGMGGPQRLFLCWVDPSVVERGGVLLRSPVDRPLHYAQLFPLPTPLPAPPSAGTA
eukprot:EG_transcript_20112